MVSDDSDVLRSSTKHSLVDSSSSSSQAVRVCVFWGSGFGERPERGCGWILSKSSLLLLVSPTLPTLALSLISVINTLLAG